MGRIFYSGEEYTPVSPSSTLPLDQMLYSADLLARSFYSAVSADLGRVHDLSVLTDEIALQQFTQNYSNIEFGLIAAGPASDSYENLKTRTGKPEVTPSTIFTTYLCQTPVRKLTTALIVSVLLADLVLLRALWSIITLVAVYIVNARDPKGKCAVLHIFKGSILTGKYSQPLHALH